MYPWLKRLSVYLPLLAVCIWFGLYQASAILLYWGQSGVDEWLSPRPARCSKWQRTKGYADLQPGHDARKALELRCEDAFRLKGEDRFVLNRTGMRIHYRLYPGQPEQPLMLYVHGINGHILHGARFVPMAQRLGFQLVAMEMSNHGESDTNGRGGAYGCREYADVEAVVGDLLKRFPQRQVLIYATSMGTMAVANASEGLMQLDQRHQLKGLILENPIPSLDRILKAHAQKPFWLPNPLIDLAIVVTGQRAGYNFYHCAPRQYLAQLHRPVFVPIARQDELIDVSLAEEVLQALPSNPLNHLKVYPFGLHSAVWNGQPKVFERDVRAFWERAMQITDY